MEDENTLPKESTSKTNNDGDTKALEETETQALVKSKKEKGKSCCSVRFKSKKYMEKLILCVAFYKYN